MANLFTHRSYNTSAPEEWQTRKQTFAAWESVTGNLMPGRLVK